MKIAICDDNPKDRLRIEQWFAANRPEIKQEDIIGFSSGEAFLRYLYNNPIDIVFLDCQMDGLDGISTTREARGNSGDIIVILVSNYTEYAVYGYELDVFRYILKSDFQTKAADVFEKALIRLEQTARKTYWVKTWGKAEKINVDEIVYIESHRNKIDILMKNHSAYSQYKKLDSVEDNLKECGFIRCHQSYLVNSRYIRRMESNTIELEDGGFIPVSRERYKAAYDMLALWASEVM